MLNKVFQFIILSYILSYIYTMKKGFYVNVICYSDNYKLHGIQVQIGKYTECNV